MFVFCLKIYIGQLCELRKYFLLAFMRGYANAIIVHERTDQPLLMQFF